tara:strand:+ start:715 stop:1989 length:1275 start_codon:yes stop_codon:yes gene_type:complete
LKRLRHYNKNNYDQYIKFQSTKSLDPVRVQKWLGEEWREKVNAFKNHFLKFGDALNTSGKFLCIGSRAGHEVAALKELGVENVVGIDTYPCGEGVIKGDGNCMEFEDESFDFVYTNILNYTIHPEKMISEIERVVKKEGLIYFQCKIGQASDEYEEVVFENPVHDILPFFNQSFCIALQPINVDVTGSNFEYVLRKDENLSQIWEKYGNVSTLELPNDYEKLWNDINLKTQEKKLDTAGIVSRKMRNSILENLKKRAYYLTRFAESFECKNIAEVGTAEGWQFYTFCKYISENTDNGKVFSCDPRDVRNIDYKNKYESERFKYFQSTSEEMSSEIGEIDMFYIDGLHDVNTVITDVMNFEKCQVENKRGVWVFDDFDQRFGCAQDILTLCQTSKCFKVYRVGKTASGFESHQALVLANFKGHSE